MVDYKKLKKDIDEELEILKETMALIVVIGFNDLSRYFIDNIKDHPGFIGIISDGETIPDDYRNYQMNYADLIFFDSKEPLFYIMSKSGSQRILSSLQELGIRIKIRKLGYGSLPRKSGSKMIDAYDPLLGKTRIDDEGNPEVIVFSDDDETSRVSDESCIRILSLGGSTSDPFYGNMKSWPEYLYEKLSSMGIHAKVIAAGMATYDSFQELKKLMRDGILLHPDIVISYSGFNEGMYNLSAYPFSLKGDREMAEHIVENEWATHETGIGESFPLKYVSMGLKDERSLFQRWRDNEHMMHGICNDLGISFIGALQPIDHRLYATEPELYQEASSFFQNHRNPDWMIDMTAIFDDVLDVYLDACHVDEEGNRKIAQFFLKEVLRLIGEREARR